MCWPHSLCLQIEGKPPPAWLPEIRQPVVIPSLLLRVLTGICSGLLLPLCTFAIWELWEERFNTALRVTPGPGKGRRVLPCCSVRARDGHCPSCPIAQQEPAVSRNPLLLRVRGYLKGSSTRSITDITTRNGPTSQACPHLPTWLPACLQGHCPWGLSSYISEPRRSRSLPLKSSSAQPASSLTHLCQLRGLRCWPWSVQRKSSANRDGDIYSSTPRDPEMEFSVHPFVAVTQLPFPHL